MRFLERFLVPSFLVVVLEVFEGALDAAEREGQEGKG